MREEGAANAEENKQQQQILIKSKSIIKVLWAKQFRTCTLLEFLFVKAYRSRPGRSCSLRDRPCARGYVRTCTWLEFLFIKAYLSRLGGLAMPLYGTGSIFLAHNYYLSYIITGLSHCVLEFSQVLQRLHN
jgi:hypothetical protein